MVPEWRRPGGNADEAAAVDADAVDYRAVSRPAAASRGVARCAEGIANNGYGCAAVRRGCDRRARSADSASADGGAQIRSRAAGGNRRRRGASGAEEDCGRAARRNTGPGRGPALGAAGGSVDVARTHVAVAVQDAEPVQCEGLGVERVEFDFGQAPFGLFAPAINAGFGFFLDVAGGGTQEIAGVV